MRTIAIAAAERLRAETAFRRKTAHKLSGGVRVASLMTARENVERLRRIAARWPGA